MDPVIFLWLIAIALVAAGVAGLVLPVLPGAALLLAGLVMAAWIEEFQLASSAVVITSWAVMASVVMVPSWCQAGTRAVTKAVRPLMVSSS